MLYIAAQFITATTARPKLRPGTPSGPATPSTTSRHRFEYPSRWCAQDSALHASRVRAGVRAALLAGWCVDDLDRGRVALGLCAGARVIWRGETLLGVHVTGATGKGDDDGTAGPERHSAGNTQSAVTVFHQFGCVVFEAGDQTETMFARLQGTSDYILYSVVFAGTVLFGIV